MLKILIVDDVPIFLDYLKGCIDWANYGFEICGEAHDGVEALAQMEELTPDIVLTDITMPYMDGLTFAEKIAKHYPYVSTILITGNSEFEYARQALKIGVCDYIVKPFEKEELLLSLLKQKDNINQALEARTHQAELESENKNSVLRKLILGRHQNWNNHLDTLTNVGIEFVSNYFMVGTLKLPLDDIGEMEHVHDWEDIIVNMLEDRIDLDGTFSVFRDYENNIVILMNFKSENEMKKYKAYELSDLKKIIKRQLNIDFTMGISGSCYSLDEIKNGYSQALAMANESNASLLYSWDVIDKLTQGLEQMNSALIEKTLGEEFNHFNDNHSPEMINSLYSGLISILLTQVIKSGQTIEAVFGPNFHPYQHAVQTTSIPEGQQYITSLYQTAVSHREENSNTKSFQVVEQVKDYINQNYSNSALCVADISKAILINQTYLRSMFKEETNLTITEYITNRRMVIAANLLKNSQEKVAVIAEMVGYNDESYFSKAFKKYYGVSPKNYSQS